VCPMPEPTPEDQFLRDWAASVVVDGWRIVNPRQSIDSVFAEVDKAAREINDRGLELSPDAPLHAFIDEVMLRIREELRLAFTRHPMSHASDNPIHGITPETLHVQPTPKPEVVEFLVPEQDG
jgi:hypothetical protein